MLIGVALALVAFPLVYWRWGAKDIALGVSLSPLAACSTATIAAMALPSWRAVSSGRERTAPVRPQP